MIRTHVVSKEKTESKMGMYKKDANGSKKEAKEELGNSEISSRGSRLYPYPNEGRRGSEIPTDLQASKRGNKRNVLCFQMVRLCAVRRESINITMVFTAVGETSGEEVPGKEEIAPPFELSDGLNLHANYIPPKPMSDV